MADEAAVLEQGGGAARPGAGWVHMAIHGNSWKCKYCFSSFSTLSHTRASFSRFPTPSCRRNAFSLSLCPIIIHDHVSFLAVCRSWVTSPAATRGSRGAGRLMGESRLKWHRSWATSSARSHRWQAEVRSCRRHKLYCEQRRCSSGSEALPPLIFVWP